MGLHNTHAAWPVALLIFGAVVWCAPPEFGRDPIRKHLAAVGTRVARTTHYVAYAIEDAFRPTASEFKKETATNVPHTSSPRRPRVRPSPTHDADAVSIFPAAEAAPFDLAIAAEAEPITAPDAGVSASSEAMIVGAQGAAQSSADLIEGEPDNDRPENH